MNHFSETLKQAFTTYKKTKLFEDLQSTYEDIKKRIVLRIRYPNDQNLDRIHRLKLNCNVYEQVLLHRAILLFEASLASQATRNVYALTLCIRGHYETTATLGFVYKQLMSFLEHNISYDDFENIIFTQTLSSKHPSLPQAPDPKNIMTQLDYADKIVDSKLFNTRKQMLRNNYEFLCEFAHPNFHSNSVAYYIDKEGEAVILRYDSPLRDEEFSLIGYLCISNSIFIWLFDIFQEYIEKIK